MSAMYPPPWQRRVPGSGLPDLDAGGHQVGHRRAGSQLLRITLAGDAGRAGLDAGLVEHQHAPRPPGRDATPSTVRARRVPMTSTGIELGSLSVATDAIPLHYALHQAIVGSRGGQAMSVHTHVVRLPLAWTLPPEAAALLVRDDERPFALVGRWAGESAQVSSETGQGRFGRGGRVRAARSTACY